MSLCQVVYKIASGYPKDEEFGLKSQSRRAIVSVPSNIAEGYSRNSAKDMVRFFRIAIGSLAETETQISLARIMGYISDETEKDFLRLSNIETRKIQAFINSINRKEQKEAVCS